MKYKHGDTGWHSVSLSNELVQAMSISISGIRQAYCIELQRQEEKKRMEKNKVFNIDDLTLAVEGEDFEEVKTIIESNAVDINQKDVYGDTPLMEAAKWENVEIARLLVENGATIHTPVRNDGKSAYGIAVMYSNTDLIQYFDEVEASGSDLKYSSEYGLTWAKKMDDHEQPNDGGAKAIASGLTWDAESEMWVDENGNKFKYPGDSCLIDDYYERPNDGREREIPLMKGLVWNDASRKWEHAPNGVPITTEEVVLIFEKWAKNSQAQYNTDIDIRKLAKDNCAEFLRLLEEVRDGG